VTDCVGVECPECDEQAIELGSGTAVTCLCTCGAMLLICRDKDGKLARREVIEHDGEVTM
jgi:ribosomal protein S27E